MAAPKAQIQDTIIVLRELAQISEPRALEDIAFVGQTNDVIQQLELEREIKRKELEADHDVLLKQMLAARTSARRPEGAPTEDDHRAKMQSLERQRFELLKEINDIEAKRDYAQGELVGMKATLAELMLKDVSSEVQLDNSTLRLHILNGLGFQTTEDGQKMIVASDADVEVFSFDDGKSELQKTNDLWDFATGLKPESS